MTQRTYLTPVVLTAATGQILAPLDQVFDLMNTLAGGRLAPGEVHLRQDEIRAELIRQHPWIFDILVPDFRRTEDPRRSRWQFLADIAAEHGGALTIETDTALLDIPGPVLGLPAGVTLIRMSR